MKQIIFQQKNYITLEKIILYLTSYSNTHYKCLSTNIVFITYSYVPFKQHYLFIPNLHCHFDILSNILKYPPALYSVNVYLSTLLL
jgi:hypothetical protein